MKRTFIKIFRITAGIILLIIGAIGGLIPIFQGWVFGLLGLWLLSQEIPFIHKYYERIKLWVETKAGKTKPESNEDSEQNKTSGKA